MGKKTSSSETKLCKFVPDEPFLYVLQAQKELNATLCLRELILAYRAEWTLEILWNILPSCAWLYASLRTTYLWVILITADITYILCHDNNSFRG